MKRALLFVVAVSLVAGMPAGRAVASACEGRMLVLSAMPGELDLLLHSTSVAHVDEVGGHSFYSGTLRGNSVVLAMTGIGLLNAKEVSELAFDHFACDGHSAFDAVVFSGVSGGKTYIGDVTIPERWKAGEDGAWHRVDPDMYEVATQAAQRAQLSNKVPAGDAACIGLDPDLVEAITLEHQPTVIAGGDGKSADPFGGRQLPCFPHGGDVFGCTPCRATNTPAPDPVKFLEEAAPFIDPNFFFDYFASPPSTSGYAAEDMETAAVAATADANGARFIAFRALSDGLGDPLMLPGFPFQFFVYRQIAADNAARVALAFIEDWAARP